MKRLFSRILGRGFVLILIGTVVLSGGCKRQQVAIPGRSKPPAQSQVPREQQSLPQRTVNVAGVEVTTGGKEVRGGAVNLASFSIAGGLFGYAQCASISPDGRWIAFQAVKEGRTEGLWVIALDGSGGRILDRVDEKDHTAGTLTLQLLGWMRDNRVLFIRQGTQPDGAHRGQRGISLRVAEPDKGEVQEVGWLPVPAGMVRQVQFLPQKESVFVHVTRSLWRMDILQQKVFLLKDKLPIYDGLFVPWLSPTGDYYAYEMHEPLRRGIYLLSIASGQEEPLAPTGLAWNFLPSFSPDGRYLAYYSAPLKAGCTGQDAGDYDLVPMEDGPAPIASEVHLVSLNEQKVARLAVPGAKIGSIKWSADGRHLVFVSGKMIKGTDLNKPGLPEMEWQSIWVADLQGEVRKIADLPSGNSGDVYILRVSADGAEVHYLCIEQNKSSLWLARETGLPVEVLPGYGSWDYNFPVPAYGNEFFLSRRTAGGSSEVFRVCGAEATQVTSDGGFKSGLKIEGNRLIYLREDNTGNGRLVVLSVMQ